MRISFYQKKNRSIVSFLLRFLYKRFNNNLFLSLYVLTNSDFLFNNWLLSNDLITNSSSVRHNLQQLILAADLITAAISHEVLVVVFKSFNCQIYLDNAVLFL